MEDKDIMTNGSCGCNVGNGRECGKLDVYDWLSDVVQVAPGNDLVEVRFKNTRKDYYQNNSGLNLIPGEIVAVEGSPGHDIGIVTLTGELVQNQIVKNRYRPRGEFKKVYRKAKANDIEKWLESIELEHETMIRSRQLVKELGLDMKIGDVEYQGDKTKGIFYYIAEGRVDFRELIKVLANNFHIRIEMKQIGARQEAGRIGGIGPCGRELCCSSWMGNFKSVSTGAARTQEVSLNPQKLAGQCGKLKCCLNYELDAYDDARKDFPSSNIQLETQEGRFSFVKSDTFKRVMYYICTSDRSVSGIKEVSVDRVKEVVALNKKGEKPNTLVVDEKATKSVAGGYSDVLSDEGESLTRFDKPRQGNNRRKQNKRPNRQPDEAGAQPNTRPASTHEEVKKGEQVEQGESRNPRRNNQRRNFKNRPQKPKAE
ncbi:MAG: stage 0 sporulation family protein [Mangrovibacterium sp.]